MSSALQTAKEFIPLEKADTDLARRPRALLVGVEGSANLMQEDGTIRENVPLQKGVNPLVIRQLRTGGDADDIWGLY